MARLPQPGGDNETWGTILNDFLSTVHNTDGTLKNNTVSSSVLAAGTVAAGHLQDGTVSAAKLAANAVSTGALQDTSVTSAKLAANAVATANLQNNSVTAAKLAAGGATDGQVLGYSSNNLVWTTPSGSGSVPDASASAKGLVQLAGDLSGTAASPTVPGLAAKAADNAVVHLTGNETITGTKNFTGTLQVGGQAAVATNDSRLTDQRTPSDASVTSAKLNVVSAPTSGQVLSYNGTKLSWVTPAAGGGGGSNGYSFTIVHKTADYTAAAYDCVFVDSVPSAVTITLPAPAANATVRVKRLAPNGNGVQVAAPAGAYIDAATGVGTDTLNSQFQSQDYWSDGSNWFRI